MQVQGFPTIKLFVDGKASDYDGQRTADGIVEFMLRKFRNVELILFRSPMNVSAEAMQVAVQVDTEDREVILDLTKKML